MRAEEKRLELNFPATPPEAEADPQLAQELEAALGVKPAWIGRNRFNKLVLLADLAIVRALRPDFGRLAAIRNCWVIVTARGDDGCDFISCFFAPQPGIPEDPVPGSRIAPWCLFGLNDCGRRVCTPARHRSARGGELWCALVGDRVTIAGRAVTYLSGMTTAGLASE
ncbi:hypothetical protein MASR2M8_02660 [Opitutaceae bacterium]